MVAQTFLSVPRDHSQECLCHHSLPSPIPKYRPRELLTILHPMSTGDAASLDQAARAAFAHQQAGRLREAEQIYRQILSRDPNHFDALQLLGLIALGSGHAPAAVELLSRAVAINDT